VLFRGLEHHALVATFNRAGTHLSNSDRAEIRGLLSASEAAEQRLATLAPAQRDQIEDIVDVAFTRGLRGVMILCVVLSALSVPPALWGRSPLMRAVISSDTAQPAAPQLPDPPASS
jgi:hypothetical protein